jgi:hypothetical protein
VVIARTRRFVALGAGGAAVALFGFTLAACSSLLGFDEVTLDTGDGGGAGSVLDGSVRDGSGDRDAALGNDGALATDGDSATDGAIDSACGDTQTSADNCGRCGHACLGSTCTAGVCDPKQIITGFFGVYGVAVDATNVYFTAREGNQVWKAGKMDGANPFKLADQPDSLVPASIVVDDTYVYWANRSSPDGEIRRCLLSGCAGASTLLYGGALRPSSLKIAGTNLYWAENNGGTVKRATRPDGGAVTTLLAADAGASPWQVAIDDKYVYATDDTSGTVRRIPFDGGAVVELTGSAGTPTYGITTSDAGVFFLADGVADGVVWRVADPQGATDGGAAAVPFASLQTSLNAVIADETNVYWTAAGAPDVANGSVLYCPLAGCPQGHPIVLAKGQGSPAQMTQDASQIYWANFGLTSSATDGAVMRVAKP